MRFLSLTLASALLFSGSALAHPEKQDEPAKPAVTMSDIELSDLPLPTEEDIDAIMDQMPDLNALFGDFIELAEDERLQKRFEKAGDAFAEKLDDSGALELDDNDLPDFNALMRVMLSAMSDEDIMGEMLHTLDDVKDVMEKHVDEDGFKSKAD